MPVFGGLAREFFNLIGQALFGRPIPDPAPQVLAQGFFSRFSDWHKYD